jgi:hypothetical protein
MLRISDFKAIFQGPFDIIGQYAQFGFAYSLNAISLFRIFGDSAKLYSFYLADAHSANLYFSADSFRVFDEGG